MAKDYIPQADAKFDEWLRNFCENLPAIAQAVGLPQNFVDDVIGARIGWNTNYRASQQAQIQAESAVETKNWSRADTQEKARTAVRVLQAIPQLMDSQRELLSITVRDTTPTPISPEYVMELDPPLLKLDLRTGQITIHFGVNPGDENKNAKPENIGGVKLWYRVGEGEWKWVGDDTNSPYMHNIDLSTCGALEYRAQWFDKRMRTGLFSTVTPATVS